MANSSYGDSIKFYERMSQLHTELKTYENEQFRLEEEFGRMWTQHQSHSIQSHSQLSPSTVDNANYAKDEERRHARNQAILAKIQELENNASVFTARSERLRMMRSEYETLVRKCASQRNWVSSSQTQWSSSKISGEFISSPSLPTFPSQAPFLVTVGVNTEITGPVRPIQPNNVLQDSTLMIDKNDSRLGTNQFSFPKSMPNDNGNNNFNPNSNTTTNNVREVRGRGEEYNNSNNNNKTHPFLMDLSTTSESEMMSLQKNNKNDKKLSGVGRTAVSFSGGSSIARLLADDTSDTTSVSILVPKSKERPALVLSLTDRSESTSMNFEPKKKYTREAANESALINSSMAAEVSATGSITVDHSMEGISTADSPTSSIGDSMTNSVQNKTPDSLPRDESQLLHITEKNENETSDGKLINEDDNEEQETQDDLSSSKLALEEIPSVDEPLELEDVIPAEISTKPTMPTTAASPAQISGFQLEAVVNAEAQSNSNKIENELVNTQVVTKPTLPVSSSEIRSEEMEKHQAEHEVKVKENEPIDDSASKKKELPQLKGTKISTSGFASSASGNTAQTNSSQPKSVVRKVRIKLDYDSESEVSDVAPIQAKNQGEGKNKENTEKESDSSRSTKPLAQQKDDDFDDFFDI